MSAFVVFQLTARDAAKVAAYSASAIPIVASHGGKALGLGPLAALQGNTSFDRGAVFEFPDRAAAEAWYADGAYQALLPLRAEAMECSVIIIG